MKNIRNNFKNADHAYYYFYDLISIDGIDYGDTKALFNVGFYLNNPLDVEITDENRNWNIKYAEAEWQWYLSGDPSIDKLGEIYGKVPLIWENMADSHRKCRSNYGWQWNRNNQIDKVVDKLSEIKDTRHAAISIYDGKEIDTYAKDTPCTYGIQFTVLYNEKLTGRQNPALNMTVLMRSNDLWYGFCNDQYCFAQLQKMIAQRLSVEVGTYYHFATNLHVYNNKLNK
jgi:thymidylate synthase